MSDASLKVKRTVQKLTNGDRKWICHRRMTYKDEKFTEMQAAFRDERNADIELKSGTVSGILKQSDKWLSIQDGQEAGTRTRSSKEPELEAALFAWRSERIANQEKVRDEDLRDKARELAAAMGINTDRCSKGLSFSSGWLDRFKKRNNIKQTRYNRHGKKDADKHGDLQHQPAFPQLADAGSEHAAAPVVAHNPAAMHGALPYLAPQMPSVMATNVPGIPSVPHSLSMPQAEGVPAAIPQPPSGPSETDDSGMMHNGPYPSGLFQLVPPPVGPPPDANGAHVPSIPVGAQVQQGMPLGPRVPQAAYVDVPPVHGPTMGHDPYQQAAMGIPAPVSDPAYHPPGAIPMPPTHGAPGPMIISEQSPLQMKEEDPDIANIPPPADIPDDSQVP